MEIVDRLRTIINKSVVNIKKNETMENGISHFRAGGVKPDEDGLFVYNWHSNDESIVKIEGSTNEKDVTIKGINPGSTDVICTLSSPDNSFEPVNKIMSVTVEGTLDEVEPINDEEKDVEEPEKEEETPTDVEVDDTSKKSNLLIISIATILSGMFIMYYKRKKLLN